MDHADRLSRRDLLALAAIGAGALVLGLDQVARAEDGWEQGAWEAALAAMQATKRYGVVVVLPPDAVGRRRVAEQLAQRIPLLDERRLDPIAPWFLETVWVLAPGERVQAQPGETLVLVDRQGKRVIGAAVPLGDAKGFAEGVEGLLAGQGRLDARAEAASPEVKQHVAAFAEKGLEAADSYEWLSRHIEEAASAVVRAWRRDRSKTTLEGLLREACAWRAELATGLPFGVKWKVDVTVPEPCPPCGMARSTVDGRKFLEFWGR